MCMYEVMLVELTCPPFGMRSVQYSRRFSGVSGTEPKFCHQGARGTVEWLSDHSMGKQDNKEISVAYAVLTGPVSR